MTRTLAALLVAGLMGVVLAAGAVPARADAAIVSATVENGYPKSLTFKLTARADVDITDVSLSYSITGRGTSALGKPDDFTAGKNVETQVVVQVNSGASYIPVGSEFAWHWEISTADGKSTSGPETKFVFLPAGQDWKSVQGAFMVVYYHGDNQDLANAYLKAGQETYQKMAVGLLNTTLKQTPVKVILFNDEKEMAPARPGTGGKFDAAVTTCGTKVTNDVVLVIPVSCGTPDKTDTLRHEFTHILTDAAGVSPLGKLPSWLDEGTAVYAQSAPGDNYSGAFEAATRSNRLIPFSQMGTPSSDANQVNLFYGESYAMASYLIKKGGPAKYAQLFATIKNGTRFDQALQQVYGFDMPGFEKEFLAANGAAPRPTATPQPRQAQPTAVPTAKPAAAANTDNGGSSIDRTTILIGGLAALFALVAVFFFLLSMQLSARRRAAGGGPPSPPDDWNQPAG